MFLETHCVAHRDLKMDNLLLNRNGRVVIADFGKAIVLNNKMDTPYMHGGCGQPTSQIMCAHVLWWAMLQVWI